ncbi:hypothetical protein EDB85DRAFT_2155196 [Lactarius pseudohatsudake]|nr:hypothetical protein EDB85DRAFT_2155196 [Lactarius pseudohatsudake]
MSLHPPAAGVCHPSAVQHSPQEVVNHLNTVLTSEGLLATLSATQWTAKNNLVITTGPAMMVRHLTSTSHLISNYLVTFLSTSQSPLPVQTRDNCKWACLLVNGIPIGASPTCGPYSFCYVRSVLTMLDLSGDRVAWRVKDDLVNVDTRPQQVRDRCEHWGEVHQAYASFYDLPYKG